MKSKHYTFLCCAYQVSAMNSIYIWSNFCLHAILFILSRIGYLDIFKVVEETCNKHQQELVVSPTLEEIIHYDLWAREFAGQCLNRTTPVPI